MPRYEYTYTFEQGCEVIRQGINRQNLDPIYQLAIWLVRTYSDRAEAYFLLNLVVCLNNRAGGARYAEPNMVAAQGCKDYTPELGGDMLRDRAMGLVRFAHGGQDDLNLAEQCIADARQLQQNDPNRLACLTDIEGRLAYARGDYAQAVRLHTQAHREWDGMFKGADQNWVYNNLVHWLKAVVRTQGAWSSEAARLSRLIRVQRPDGAPNRHREARVIRVPLVGNPIHDFLTTRR